MSSQNVYNLPQNFRPNTSDTPQALSITSTATALTAFHANTTHVRIGVSGAGGVRYSYRGTDPTASAGYRINEGDAPLDVLKSVAEGMKFIAVTGTMVVHATGGTFQA